MSGPPARRPIATYRLQLGPDLDLEQARELVPYLSRLGVGDLYLSPVTTAAPGSAHGYDVADPNEVSPALGGEKALRRLAEVAHDAGLGVMIDVVPNHMSTDPANQWWSDVLRHGPHSDHAAVFDIDWQPADHPELHGKVLLPVLGEPLNDELAAGTLTVEGDHVRYHELILPLAAGTGDGDAQQVLARQHFRLEHWRTGRQRVNWRRFFGLAELVGVRVEDPAVFDLTHRLVLRLAADGVVDALRIDHIDGLADPEGYLSRLRHELPGPAFPVVVEKILGPRESLRPWWAVDGTTGYDFLDRINGLFADPAGTERLNQLDGALTERGEPFAVVARRAQEDIVDRLFTADVETITAAALAGAHDVDRSELRAAVVAAAVALPVYRTYLRADHDPAEVDRMLVVGALADARRHGVTAPAAEHLRAVLLGEGPSSAEVADEWHRARARWQQLTGPVMAKGVEDTACYAHVAVAGLNDVGTAPDHHHGDPVARFHDRNREQAQRWPDGLNATATHDTKRGEDTRLRLVALTVVAEDWARAVIAWHEQAAPLRSTLDGSPAPDAGDELLVYQTVVGTSPGGHPDATYVDRMKDYMVKAAREAKRHTSWIDPSVPYEEALTRFVEGALVGDLGRELAEWGQRMAEVAAGLSLTQTVLKIASPGVPDLYQGTELWDLSLVDPDNRRPVDFVDRQERMDRIGDQPWIPVDAPNEADKLAVTVRALRARRRRPDLYRSGLYRPLQPDPSDHAGVVGFTRRLGDEWALVAARTRPELLRADVTMELPAGAPRRWIDALTGQGVETPDLLRAGDVLHGASVVLLEPSPR